MLFPSYVQTTYPLMLVHSGISFCQMDVDTVLLQLKRPKVLFFQV